MVSCFCCTQPASRFQYYWPEQYSFLRKSYFWFCLLSWNWPSLKRTTGDVWYIQIWGTAFYTPPRTMKLLGGYIGFTPSIRLCVRPSVCLSVPPSRIPCPLRIAYSSGWIHLIFIHLIKQLKKMCRVYSFLQNCKIKILVWWFHVFYFMTALPVYRYILSVCGESSYP